MLRKSDQAFSLWRTHCAERRCRTQVSGFNGSLALRAWPTVLNARSRGRLVLDGSPIPVENKSVLIKSLSRGVVMVANLRWTRYVALVGLLLISSAYEASAENWPRFRGPTGQGISSETNLPLTWSATENVAWKAPIAGEGWSSPIIWDNRVIITTATDDGKSCHVICLDRRTGDEMWDTEVFTQETRHKRPDYSYATPTCVTDGERIFAVFAAGGIVALDMDGNKQWENHEVEFFSQHGLGASPILADGMVIMPFDGSSPADELIGFKKGWDGAVIMALDQKSGEVKWRGKRGLSRLAHVTPQVVDVDGEHQLISAAGDVIQSHDLKTGELVWTVRSQGEGVTPSIVTRDGISYSCSGFEKPTIRAVKFGGHGDVTETHLKWEQTRGVPALASLLLVGPHLYAVTDQGVLTCFDAETKEEVWRERIGGRHSPSPVFADGRIYFLSEQGESVVIEPGAEYKELARNNLGGLCRASIAVSQGNLFLRNDEGVFCIGPKPE
jgi:outer membrane protein assembly factor BamB